MLETWWCVMAGVEGEVAAWASSTLSPFGRSTTQGWCKEDLAFSTAAHAHVARASARQKRKPLKLEPRSGNEIPTSNFDRCPLLDDQGRKGSNVLGTP